MTQANSNFIVHSGPFKASDQCNNLTDVLTSHRQEADDVLIGNSNGHKKGSPQTRDSIVGKSLQSVKNIFKKAKEGDFHSLVGKTTSTNPQGFRSRVVDHETVELEL